ncbi:hypothetical protein PR202_gb24805 [Eleusine coracana subsp. coracana]|uniref:Uncharacterized protein n=1 Tax=Eleusine coracana subsp. coracana TaxID=191504 RepID=A0AAV5FJM5_ELECO|nr:hypothetical protein PR202_gb24805 [Eleusine coracana subsp. coracana]
MFAAGSAREQPQLHAMQPRSEVEGKDPRSRGEEPLAPSSRGGSGDQARLPGMEVATAARWRAGWGRGPGVDPWVGWRPGSEVTVAAEQA